MTKYFFLTFYIILLLSCNEKADQEVTSYEIIKIGRPENDQDTTLIFGAAVYHKVNMKDSTYLTKYHADEDDDTISTAFYHKGKTTALFHSLSRDVLEYLSHLDNGPLMQTHLSETAIYCGGTYMIAFNKDGKEKYYSFQIRNLPSVIDKWYWEMRDNQDPGIIVGNTNINTDSIIQYYAEKPVFDSILTPMPKISKVPIIFIPPKSKGK